MPDTDFSEGIYTLLSALTPNLAIDWKDGKAATNQFTGCESQRWQLKKALDIAWTFQNVSNGRYLGMTADDKAGNGRRLYEVSNRFSWHLQRGDPESCISLFVPFTNHVIHLGGTALYIHEKGQGPHQEWHLCKDLHMAASQALRNGGVYRILNALSKTAVEAVEGRAACFKADNVKDNQKFLAVKTENGWAFRHVESQEYLGIQKSVGDFENRGYRLLLVKKEFTFVVLPHHEDTSKFKIWIPFTSRVMDLDWGYTEDNTPIHMHGTGEHECQWWNFQRVLVATDENIDGSEALPGPPRS